MLSFKEWRKLKIENKPIPEVTVSELKQPSEPTKKTLKQLREELKKENPR